MSANQGGLETWYDNTWRRGLPDGKVVATQVVGFRGGGWQGQAIIVLVPERIVVVRMREPSQGNTEAENRKYGFPDLVKLARSLVGADGGAAFCTRPGRQHSHRAPRGAAQPPWPGRGEDSATGTGYGAAPLAK